MLFSFSYITKTPKAALICPGFIHISLWVDNCILGSQKNNAHEEKLKMKQLFDCDNSGTVKEYIGTKVDINKKEELIRLT